jgi:hypothetical protein
MSKLNLMYSADIDALVKEGDRIRFTPLNQSMFSDKSGNLPAQDNPWIGVMGDGNQKTKFSVQLKSDVATIKKEVTPSTDPSPSRTCLQNPVTQKLDCIQDGIVVETRDTATSPLQGVVWEIKLDVPRGAAYNEAPAWDSLHLEYDIPIYTNLGTFVQRFRDRFSIPSNVYLSSTGTISLFVEWAPRTEVGLTSMEGRAVGTGVYVTKVDLKTEFLLNKKSEKASYDKTMRFGIRRVK